MKCDYTRASSSTSVDPGRNF